MELRNHTPFTPFVFYSVAPDDREFGVALLRADLSINTYGKLAPTQKPARIVKTDDYVGEPGKSSLYYESDLAPFKPGSDIVAHGDAVAPNGRPCESWMISLRVGAIERALHVTGPRRWRRQLSGWYLERPEPANRVRLGYELAFGGSDSKSTYQQNPIGTGHVTPAGDEAPGPQIEDPIVPITAPCGRHAVAGFGPIARSWQPRLGFAGTFDEAWRNERAPRLPHDFSYSHYNCAPAGLVGEKFLTGDEEIVAHGLGSPGRRSFRLPGLGMAIVGRRRDGREAVAPMFLDTLWIDFTRNLVRLAWRGSFAGRGILTHLALVAKPARA